MTIILSIYVPKVVLYSFSFIGCPFAKVGCFSVVCSYMSSYYTFIPDVDTIIYMTLS